MFDKIRFKDLLEFAIDGDTITDFAERSKVNRTYLSKLMNLKLEKPPSPDIIRKIASKAKNYVSYEALMVEAGYIYKNGNFVAEGVNAPYNATSIGELVKLPVLGKIAAGIPLEAQENIIDYVEVLKSEVANGDYFYLQVDGDSMIGSGIKNGYRVLVRQQLDVESNEIAVVRVDGYEATLKRVKKVDGQVILYPDNPNYDPIIINSKDAIIIGKVVKVEFDPNKRY